MSTPVKPVRKQTPRVVQDLSRILLTPGDTTTCFLSLSCNVAWLLLLGNMFLAMNAGCLVPDAVLRISSSQGLARTAARRIINVPLCLYQLMLLPKLRYRRQNLLEERRQQQPRSKLRGVTGHQPQIKLGLTTSHLRMHCSHTTSERNTPTVSVIVARGNTLYFPMTPTQADDGQRSKRDSLKRAFSSADLAPSAPPRN